MARFSNSYTETAVYIYKTVADSNEGKSTGGSGFVVNIPFEKNPKYIHVYVVTNRHVVIKAGNPVIRFNAKEATDTKYLETRCKDWVFHRYSDDVAVYPIKNINWSEMRFGGINRDMFVTRALIDAEDIGIGDETIMIGRFMGHDGKQRNVPAVRFGNIAMMPGEPIVSYEGIKQESFLVEVRSLPGYSGSAVILLSPGAGPGSHDMSIRRKGMDRGNDDLDTLKNQAALGLMLTFMQPKGPYLLGIDWCHLRNTAVVQAQDGKPYKENLHVEQNSGMAGVIPAWKIAEVLDGEELVQERKRSEDEWERKQTPGQA